MQDLLHKSHARLAASSKLLLHGNIVDGSKGVKNLPHILLLHMQAPQVSTFVLAQKNKGKLNPLSEREPRHRDDREES